MPDIPNFGSPSHLVRSINEKSLMRKVVHSYGSVPAYDSFTTSRELPPSPNMRSIMPPLIEGKNIYGKRMRNSLKNLSIPSGNTNNMEDIGNPALD